jgi:WD40 repeat protein
VRICDANGERLGQGLCVPLEAQTSTILVLTCHHVIARASDRSRVPLTIFSIEDQEFLSIRASYCSERSDPYRDIAVLIIVDAPMEIVGPALVPLPESFPVPADVVGIVRPRGGGSQRFDARLTYATRLSVEIDKSTLVTIPRAWRLRETDDVRPGISGSPIVLNHGVIGLTYASRAETSDYSREAYVLPIESWFDKNPELLAFSKHYERMTRSAYVSLPPLLDQYVEREEEIAELRQALTKERTSRSIAMIASQGMAGLGKTLLVQAVCYDEAVERAFPDGIVWLPIGKESTRNVTTLMCEVSKTFGEDLAADASDLSATNWYKSAMSQRAALIVLDDVWRASDLDPFRADSPRSRLLFTTRDASIANAFGVDVLTPGFLGEKQSRELLAHWTSLSIDALPHEAEDLMEECGGLPLAIASLGGMLRGKSRERWQRVLGLLRNADIAKLRHQFPDYPHPDLLRALRVSIDELDPKMKERYLALAVMLEDVSIHPEFQSALWSSDGDETWETAEEFIRLALAQRDGERGSIRLHDLCVDFVRANYRDRKVLEIIHSGMRLSTHIIQRKPEQFVPQLVGRLIPYLENADVRDFSERIAKAAPRPWLRPLCAALEAPGTGLIRTLVGHANGVRSVAVTANGRRAVSGSTDNTLLLWDLQVGRVLREFTGHSGWVLAVAATANGRYAVSGSFDRTVKVWDLESGRVEHTLTGHKQHVLAVAVTLDGLRAVSGSYDCTIKVWDLKSGRLERTLEGHSRSVGAVAVTSDGRTISGSLDKTVRVWDTESGTTLKVLEGHERLVSAVAVAPNGQIAVSGSDDNTIKVWNLDAGRLERTIEAKCGSVFSISVTNDAKRIISGSRDKTIRIWDLRDGRLIHSFVGHIQPVTSLALIADGSRVISGSDDGTLKIWELNQANVRAAQRTHLAPVQSVAVIPATCELVSVSHDNVVKILDRTGEHERKAFHVTPGSSRAIAVIPKSRGVVLGSFQNTFQAWDIDSGSVMMTFVGNSDAGALAVTPDGHRVISGSGDGTLNIWEIKTGRKLETSKSRTSGVRALAIATDNRRVIFGSDDGTLTVWDLDSREELAFNSRHAGPVTAVALTPDGRTCVSSSHDKCVRLWDLETGELRSLLEGHTDWVKAIAVTADGARAASGSYDGTVRVWDLQDGEALAEFICEAPVTSCSCLGENIVVAGDLAGHVYVLGLEV